MEKNKKKRIIALAVVFIFAICVVLSIRESTGRNPDIEVQKMHDDSIDQSLAHGQDDQIISTELVLQSTEHVPEQIPVYICGAVNLPGVYYVQSGSFLFELIDEAGGFSDEAAVDYINLVLIIWDSISLYIPSHTEIETMTALPDDPAGVIIRTSSYTYSWGINDENSSEFSPVQSSGLININTASVSELSTLPGIGEVTAQAIITYRETQGSFGRIEDIMNVSGIKDARFNNIQAFITVD